MFDKRLKVGVAAKKGSHFRAYLNIQNGRVARGTI
jgi:hypothetical protein